MKCWLQIDPEEFIDTMPLGTVVTRQPITDKIANYDEASILAAIQNKQITVEQAVWLHNHNKDWEITA